MNDLRSAIDSLQQDLSEVAALLDAGAIDTEAATVRCDEACARFRDKRSDGRNIVAERGSAAAAEIIERTRASYGNSTIK